MNLATFLHPGAVLWRVTAADKSDLLNQLIAALPLPGDRQTQEELRKSVREGVFLREEQDSTGIGDGLAFPHVRVPGLPRPLMAVAIPAEPVEYGSVDGQPVAIAVMVAVPYEAPTVFLKIMAQLARFLGSAAERRRFLEAGSPEEVFRILHDADLSVAVPIRAQDIMRPPPLLIARDAPLSDVTTEMLRTRLDAAVVVDETGVVVGEITCDLLFRFGLPDFFASLKSVSFISEFDPFEKYFEKEAAATASDVMTSTPPSVPPDATLLEIVFALAVQRHLNVYVLDAQRRCVGFIDRITVLDRILNL